jgi:geranylgeranyl reductase family protein
MMDVLSADVAVIGGGPAGAAAAVRLAEQGVQVVLLDRARFPRDKVCGDGLLPDAFAPLARLGVLDQVRERAHSVRGIRFQTPSGVQGFVPVEALVIPRVQLDALLVERARLAGARVVEGARLEGFEGERGRWRAAVFSFRERNGGTRVEAGWFVLATGASPRPRQLAGLRPAPRAGAAVRSYLRLPGLARDELLIVFKGGGLPRGYYWAFPIGDGIFNLGCGVFASRPGDPSLVEEARDFAGELGAMTAPEPVRGAPLQSSFPRLAAAKGNVLAVGEAAGLTRPFSGEGIASALESGLLAAHALGSGEGPDPARHYRRLLQRRFAREFAAYRWGERLLGWPWLVTALVRRVEASATARARVKAVLAAVSSPASLLSVRGVGRLLLGR